MKRQSLLECSNLIYYRKRESEEIIVLPWKNRYRPGVLVLFDDTTAYIAIQVGIDDLAEEQKGAIVLNVNDALELVYRLGTGQCLYEREREMATVKGTSSCLERDDVSTQFSQWFPTPALRSEFCSEE